MPVITNMINILCVLIVQNFMDFILIKIESTKLNDFIILYS